ncbi:MAG: topoisomerase C-terminal repeat-containing protein, partial [Alphaproteobacteria bacterium]
SNAKPLRVVGAHPADGKPVEAGTGRYGPFVKHGKIYANLPKDRSPDEVQLDEALRLIEERAAKAGGGKPRRGARAGKARDAATGDGDGAKTKAKTPKGAGAKAAKPDAAAKPRGGRRRAADPAG